MKVRITFKTPDALRDAAADAAAEAKEQTPGILSEQAADNAFDKVMEVGELFIKYGEYVTLELDTKTKTCIVVKI